MSGILRQFLDIFREHHFSKRLIIVYTLLLAIPVAVFFLLLIQAYNGQRYKDMENRCRAYSTETVKTIDGNLSSMDLMEKMVNSNVELITYFSQPAAYSEDETIEAVSQGALSVERALAIEPKFSAIRIFADDDGVPERFPVILHSSRTNLENLEKWQFGYKSEFLKDFKYEEDVSVCTTRRLCNGKKPVGYIQMTMPVENFFPFLYAESEKYEGNHIFYYDRDSNVKQLSDSVTEERNGVLSESAVEKIASRVGQSSETVSFEISDGGKKYLVSAVYIPELKLISVHTRRTDVFDADVVTYYVIFAIAIVISLILFFIIITYITTKLLRGIFSIIDGMKEVRKGNFDVVIPVTSKVDEISETQRTFNSMTEKIRSQIEEIKNEQHLIADTEMKAMQNQINAHFLYNVLETIHMQALLKEDNETAESILVLGKMMRYCLRWRVHSVTLAQEMEYINSYINILNIRNDYKITLKSEIPEKLMDKEIPKMLVQPFVENSFYHGIEPVAEDAVIKIYTEIDEEKERLYLCVQDFGLGMSEEKVKEIKAYLEDVNYERDSQGSIGVKNIQQRLFMFYGLDYKLEIISKEGEGTLIKVPVPHKKDS